MQSTEQWYSWFEATGFETILPHKRPNLASTLEGQTVFVVRRAPVATIGLHPATNLQTGSHGTFLVTGGLGGVGLVTSRWLAECCKVQGLVLTSRQGTVKDSVDKTTVKLIKSSPVYLKSVACDVTQLEQSQSLLSASSETCNGRAQVNGIIHSVGVLADALIENQHMASFKQVMSPKLDGAHHLHTAVQGQHIDCFVVYSSIAGIIGATGQSPHATANAALDSFVAWRKGLGNASLGVQWGTWSQIGYAARVGADSRSMKAGVPSFSPALGLRALHTAYISQCSMLVTFITAGIATALPGTHQLVQGLTHVLKHQQHAVSHQDIAAVDNCAAAPCQQEGHEQHTEAITSMVLSKVCETTGLDAIGLNDPLMDAGVDSLAAMELRYGLQREVGDRMKLPSTLIFDYPSISAIVQFILPQQESQAILSGVLPEMPISRATSHAIQAIECISTGQALSQTTFWSLLLAGVEALAPIPVQRFDAAALDGTALQLGSKSAHFLTYVERFDNLFFRISPAEAEEMDPHQRLLLEVGYSALAQSGETRDSLLSSATGVFVGVMSDIEWVMLRYDASTSAPSAYQINGGGSAALSGRVSFVLGLKGPCFTVNTVCSSSLVALDAAAQTLTLGKCASAVVAGVNLLLHSSAFVMLSVVGALAPNGSCKTFDTRADGLGRGDSCCALVMSGAQPVRPTSLLSGCAVNEDGQSASMSAPNGPSQAEVIQAAVAHAGGVSARHCTETRGTGTRFGDPIEVGALNIVFCQVERCCRWPLATARCPQV